MADTAKSWNDVHRQLQGEIISGQLNPRERLVEDEVIARNGAPRRAVRRGFTELEHSGLVVRQPNKGVHVRNYSLKELTGLAEAHREASRARRFGQVFELNNAFHGRIYAAAGNPPLAEAIAHYTFATHPIRTRAFPNDAIREIAIEEHFRMIEILGRGDPAALREVILSHIRRPKDFCLKANFLMERAL